MSDYGSDDEAIMKNESSIHASESNPSFRTTDWTTPPPPAPPLPPRRQRLRRSTTIAAATGLFAAAGAGIGLATVGSGVATTALTSQTANAATIAKAVDPGLVDVLNSSNITEDEAAGTGIVLTSTGEVLTNNHVIDGATSVKVRDVGNGKTYTARVVGYDRTKDVAVLQLEDASGLTVASLGNSATIATGASVIGIGNAGGSGGTPSYAAGSVTALNQSITASDESTGASEQLTGLIETDADIQPGDSGGSLVNSSGQVVGMDTAASSSQSETYGNASTGNAQSYAIPINEALAIARQIESGTSSSSVHIGSTAYLGIFVAPAASAHDFGGFNFGGSGNSGGTGDATSSTGVAISEVVSGSPAALAGLVADDTITAVSGHAVTNANELANIMTTEKVGTTVSVRYLNAEGVAETATVHLTAGPSQ